MKRAIIELGNDENKAEFYLHGGGELNIELYSRWAGDSESGFGRTLEQTLSAADACRLRDWLNQVLPQSTEAEPISGKEIGE